MISLNFPNCNMYIPPAACQIVYIIWSAAVSIYMQANFLFKCLWIKQIKKSDMKEGIISMPV